MNSSLYTENELMAISCAKEIKNGELVLVGVGLPMIGAQIAQYTFAKESIFIYETGGVGSISRRTPVSVMDNPTTENAITINSMWRIFGDIQSKHINRGIIGGAQIDKYGNINSTVIGDYHRPKVRLAGSGGANDIGSSCDEVTIVIKLKDNNFVKKVDYITTVGHLSGYDSRQKSGLIGGGPSAVITQKGIFRFDPESKEMYLDSLYPGVEVSEITSLVPWDLKISRDLKIAEPPTLDELDIIQNRDPLGIMLNIKKKISNDFNEYYKKINTLYD